MTLPDQHCPANRLLVVCPSWVGDTVMASPTLRALRQLYPKAHITALLRQSVRPLLEGCPWIDRMVTIRPGKRRVGIVALARRLAAGKFDTAVLLTNSFRWALLTRAAGIPRRIGYDRDGRGFLLTDRLLPRRDAGQFVPVSTRDYYLGLARYLGAHDPDPTMQLFTRPEDDARTRDMLSAAGTNDSDPLVLITPGASNGPAKIWDPSKFAEVADFCAKTHGAMVAASGGPRERAIIEQVLAAARTPIINLLDLGLDLTLLKSIVRRSSLIVTNDTGPRHIAAAFNVPVVTIFGPTNPAWTETDCATERQVSVEVDCGPCQKKRCPLRGTPEEHICMRRIDSAMVCAEVTQLL